MIFDAIFHAKTDADSILAFSDSNETWNSVSDLANFSFPIMHDMDEIAFDDEINEAELNIEWNRLGYCHRQDSESYKTYYLFVFCAGYAMPLLIIAFCYVHILITVRMRRRVNLRRSRRSQGSYIYIN